jgi:hypothetical protein
MTNDFTSVDPTYVDDFTKLNVLKQIRWLIVVCNIKSEVLK